MGSEKYISNRVRSIQLSAIRQFFNMVSEVPGALSLTLGQPDFNTPDNIKEAGITAIMQDYTAYSHNQGFIELRKEVSSFLKRKYNLDYDGETEITVTAGTGQAIDASMRTFIGEGDEVLIPSPGYVAYGACATLCGGRPVYVPVRPGDGFKLKAEILENYITPRTKLLILSYPCNPTGATMNREDLIQIAEVAKKRDLIIMSDEVYSELTYEKSHISIASLEGMKDRTVVINGFSKTYSMTGWRLGFVAAPHGIMEHIVKVHQYNITCAPSISQIAGIEALKNGDRSIDIMVEEYNNRRIYCYDRIIKMGMDCFEPSGAFYLFPNIDEFGLSSDEFCRKLLFEGKLAVVPGSAFGVYGEGYIRVSYAYSMDILKEGLDRLQNFTARLRKNDRILKGRVLL